MNPPVTKKQPSDVKTTLCKEDKHQIVKVARTLVDFGTYVLYAARYHKENELKIGNLMNNMPFIHEKKSDIFHYAMLFKTLSLSVCNNCFHVGRILKVTGQFYKNEKH